MQGFDGKDEFPLAPGSVRGYRWWQLRIQNYPASNYTMTTAVWDEFSRTFTPRYVPPAGLSSQLIGMYGGPWDKHAEWHEAECSLGYDPYTPYYDVNLLTPHHVPCGICGCGYWAYWKSEDHGCNPVVSSFSGIDVPVFGVIEGAGRALIGTRGFRVQKARILAVTPVLEPVFSPLPCSGTLTSDGVYIPDSSPLPLTFSFTERCAMDGAILVAAFGRALSLREPSLEKLAERLRQVILAALHDSVRPGARVLLSPQALTAEFPPDTSYLEGRP